MKRDPKRIAEAVNYLKVNTRPMGEPCLCKHCKLARKVVASNGGEFSLDYEMTVPVNPCPHCGAPINFYHPLKRHRSVIGVYECGACFATISWNDLPLFG